MVIEAAVAAVESQIEARLSKNQTRKKSGKFGAVGEAIQPFVGSIVENLSAELQSKNVFLNSSRRTLNLRR